MGKRVNVHYLADEWSMCSVMPLQLRWMMSDVFYKGIWNAPSSWTIWLSLGRKCSLGCMHKNPTCASSDMGLNSKCDDTTPNTSNKVQLWSTSSTPIVTPQIPPSENQTIQVKTYLLWRNRGAINRYFNPMTSYASITHPSTQEYTCLALHFMANVLTRRGCKPNKQPKTHTIQK